MTDLARLVVALEAQTAKYQSGLDAATKKLSKFQRETNGILGTIDKRFRSFSSGIGNVLGAIGIGFSVKAVIDATVEAEKAQALLENAIKATGGAAGFTAKELSDYAGELQKVTSYDDEAIMGLEQLLLRFQSIKGDNFKRATADALDLSAALGVDLPAAAKLIGKALEDPVKGAAALAKQGVVLSDGQKNLVKNLMAAGRQAEAQGVILSALEGKYKGAAQAVRNTLGGALSGLKNSFNDLLEGDGSAPQFTEAINGLTTLLNSPDFKSGIGALIDGFFQVVTFGAQAAQKVGEFISNARAAIDEAAGKEPDIPSLEQLNKNLESNLKILDQYRAMSKPLQWITGAVEDQEKWIAKIRETIELRKRMDARVIPPPPASAPAAGGAPPPTPATEEFLKIEERLKEQIALYGKVGEEAKYAYQIQAGELDELSKSEQRRVLGLARQYDAQVKAADLAKEQAAADEKLKDQQAAAQKQLDDSYDSQIIKLKEQLTLVGEATELDKIHFDIQTGSLKGITAERAKYLESLAKEVDLLQERSKLEAQVKAVVEANLTPQEKFNRTIAELNDLWYQSSQQLGGLGLSYEAYTRAVEKAQKELQDSTQKTSDFMVELAQSTDSLLTGAFSDAMNGEFDNILDNFERMLQQMVAKSLAADVGKKIFGIGDGSKGSMGGGLLDKGISFVSGLFGGTRDAGGRGEPGKVYKIGTGAQPEYFAPDQAGSFHPAGRSGSGAGGGGVNNWYIQGTVSEYTRRQLDLDAARRQRAAARFS